MNLWRRIKKLSVKQLFKLSLTLLRHPFLIVPTWKATRRALKICNSLYGKAHHKNGKPNAFRHALWNMLICDRSMKWTNNEIKSVEWAKRITNLHEKLAPNSPLETAMDLHNNEIGRACFLTDFSRNEAEIIDFLQKKLQNALKVKKMEEISKSETLIYID